jgi:hypothetical protein
VVSPTLRIWVLSLLLPLICYSPSSIPSAKGIFKETKPKDEVVEIKEAAKWVLGHLLQHKLNLHFEHLVGFAIHHINFLPQFLLCYLLLKEYI